MKNPYVKEIQKEIVEDRTIIIDIGKSVVDYIRKAFPNICQINDSRDFYKRKYAIELECRTNTCKVEFLYSEVVEIKYLDILVEGDTKANIIECLEKIHDKLFSTDIRENYIDIISYDSISEYYCNKMYPKLNTLERNLRKLLFNIYILNFGYDYYKATIEKSLQERMKKLIRDDGKREKDKLKEEFHTNSSNVIDEIEQLRLFFYSFGYSDFKKLLFTPSWTSTDENQKLVFLEEHSDLSKLSDAELRVAFSDFVPKTDWERFFSNKILIAEVSTIINQIQQYRNSVAHFKFFYRKDYVECSQLVKQLNLAILKAIKITEEKDFAEKNAKALKMSIERIKEKFANIMQSYIQLTRIGAEVVIPATLMNMSKYFQGVMNTKGGNFAFAIDESEDIDKNNDVK